MTINFKYQLKQPIFFFENGSIQKGYIVKQLFQNEVLDTSLDASKDNVKVDKYYQVQLHSKTYMSKRFQEEDLFYSREEFFKRMEESWNNLKN